jgi:predicted hydrolase (HD superfamily)
MTNPSLSRDRAWALVTEHVSSESLRRHLVGAEAAVRGYARMWGEDEDAWGFVALVHDMDYEQFPDAEHHPYKCVEWLTARVPRLGDARHSVARRLFGRAA